LNEESRSSVQILLKDIEHLLLWRQATSGKQKQGLYSALMYDVDSAERSMGLCSGYTLN